MWMLALKNINILEFFKFFITSNLTASYLFLFFTFNTPFFVYFFACEQYFTVLRSYSWLIVQGSFLVVAQWTKGCQGMNLSLTHLSQTCYLLSSSRNSKFAFYIEFIISIFQHTQSLKLLFLVYMSSVVPMIFCFHS